MANYETILTDEFTGEIASIKSNDRIIFEEKIRKKTETWERREEKRRQIEHKQNKKEDAEQRTVDALQEIDDFNNILNATLKIDDKIDWEKIKSTKIFRQYKANKKPKWSKFEKRIPKPSFFEFLGIGKTKRLETEKNVKKEYQDCLTKYNQDEEKRKKTYEQEKSEYEKQQKKFNENLIKIKQSYEECEAQGILNYLGLVLERSCYPEKISLNYDLNFDENSKLLLLDLDVPKEQDFPNKKEFKYVANRNEITEKTMGKKEFENFYNDVIYQIILRTIHEVFESDYNNTVDLIVLNAWVDTIDKATGQPFRACICTVQVERDKFLGINLAMIDHKECFRSLKGITAGSLIKSAPVKPIMQLNTEDKRFITADEILDGIDEKQNLALMDWLDFETLVRDLFAKEFSNEGCKVEITQASRDAGVDAIAFDEDPIRGGKYVIQAKRYNNIVPLTAVRDLYGTVMNEGAVKGVLVTTSYYGKDALEFVKDKPLKLINGEELLYMFSKHGYKLKIELQKKEKRASSKTY